MPDEEGPHAEDQAQDEQRGNDPPGTVLLGHLLVDHVTSHIGEGEHDEEAGERTGERNGVFHGDLLVG